MIKSLYAQYIEEREGKFIIEHAEGFATYLFLSEHVYIEDIFVTKEARKSGVAAQLADQIAEIAREKGFKKLLGSVDIRANGADTSLKVLQAYGFKLYKSEQNMIYLEKSLI